MISRNPVEFNFEFVESEGAKLVKREMNSILRLNYLGKVSRRKFL